MPSLSAPSQFLFLTARVKAFITSSSCRSTFASNFPHSLLHHQLRKRPLTFNLPNYNQSLSLTAARMRFLSSLCLLAFAAVAVCASLDAELTSMGGSAMEVTLTNTGSCAVNLFNKGTLLGDVPTQKIVMTSDGELSTWLHGRMTYRLRAR